ncbi:MAG: hypothetical protein BGO95_05065 [Micrococcales bacterium 73-13]|mgnify:CR=1 FL=1|nr:MAG: hypothetical protein BGO95_05065 [Micrococcales bacterium 73-13]
MTDSRTRTVPRRSWRSLGTLPVVAAVLTALNGLFILLVAFGNITDYSTNQAFVQHVLSMDTTNFGGTPGQGLDPDVMWHAIADPVLQNIGYVLIILWESAAGVILAVGFGYWIAERGRGYRTARALSTIGLLMIAVLFMGGFIAIGGEWFQMWRSAAWNGEDAALRSAILAVASLVFVHLPSRHWHPDDAPAADPAARV